jgi:hypothetical protein
MTTKRIFMFDEISSVEQTMPFNRNISLSSVISRLASEFLHSQRIVEYELNHIVEYRQFHCLEIDERKFDSANWHLPIVYL